LREGQHFVYGAGASDGGKLGHIMGTQHDQVSLLSFALAEQFLSRILAR
jgi:hypothetical protein